jgi:hypothetical protein
MPIQEQLYIFILFTHERRAALSAWNGGLALQELKLVFLELTHVEQLLIPSADSGVSTCYSEVTTFVHCLILEQL